MIAAVFGLAGGVVGSAEVASAQNPPPPSYAYYDWPVVRNASWQTNWQAHGYYYYSPWYYVLSFENFNAIVFVGEVGDFYRAKWTCVHMISGSSTTYYSPWRLQEQPTSTNYLWAGCGHGYFLSRAGFPVEYPHVTIEVA